MVVDHNEKRNEQFIKVLELHTYIQAYIQLSTTISTRAATTGLQLTGNQDILLLDAMLT